jgi:hypothetical protein
VCVCVCACRKPHRLYFRCFSCVKLIGNWGLHWALRLAHLVELQDSQSGSTVPDQSAYATELVFSGEENDLTMHNWVTAVLGNFPVCYTALYL